MGTMTLTLIVGARLVACQTDSVCHLFFDVSFSIRHVNFRSVRPDCRHICRIAFYVDAYTPAFWQVVASRFDSLF